MSFSVKGIPVFLNQRLLAAVALGATACGTGPIPTPPAPPPPPPAALGPPCSPADTVRIAPLQGLTLDCAAGTTVTLAGNGAKYLVVPGLGAGGVGTVDNTVYPFTLAVSGLPPVVEASPAGLQARPADPGLAQWQAEAWFMGRARRLAPEIARTARLSPPSPSAPPTLGSTATFRVSVSTAADTFSTVTATLKYVGANALVYVDNASPAGGFSDPELAGFGAHTDQVVVGSLTTAFGAPTDLDGNGHVIVLLTPLVNGLANPVLCRLQGFVAGYFDAKDFAAGVNSNHGEIFYAVAPDPTGARGCAHTAAEVRDFLPSVMLHEMQHMISVGQHVAIRQGPIEEGWLDEGLSGVAEELGAIYYETRYPAPAGRTNPAQLFPDSAQRYIVNPLTYAYDYVFAPDTISLTLHQVADGGRAWRAGDWLLLRYVGDQFGTGIYKQLIQSGLTGPANLAAATGIPLHRLLANFGVALYTDSIPGVPRTSVPAVYRFKSRNLRQLFQAIYNTYGPQNGFPLPFPLAVHGFTPNGGRAGITVPGAIAFFGLLAGATTPAVSIQFGPLSGGSFAAALHPQVSVFRIP